MAKKGIMKGVFFGISIKKTNFVKIRWKFIWNCVTIILDFNVAFFFVLLL